MLTMLIAFLVALYLDALWVVYLRAIGGNRALTAGLTSAVLLVSSWFGASLVVASPHALVAGGVGAFVGTVGVMRWKQRKTCATG